MSASLTALGLPLLSQETFNSFRALIFKKTGINMRDGKQILISNRLRRRLAALGLSTYEEYYSLLTSGRAGEGELHNFIDAVSTNETYFYREVNHFHALQKVILPELLRRRRPVRIWSAGCSTGEEAYTLRMVVEEALAEASRDLPHPAPEVSIIGTDISTAAISRARDGVYGDRSLRLVPKDMLEKYFTPAEGCGRRIRPEIRARVDFRVHNLFDDPPPFLEIDVIVCRNVMIYFNKATQVKLVDEIFARALDPDGYLFIGHSESLSGFTRKFRYTSTFKAPIYRMKKEGAS